MNKFKVEQLAGQRVLVVQGQKGQQISEREYYAISTGQVHGLLRAEAVRKSNTFKLNYNISGFISLREFLVNPLNKQSFARLLENILNNLKALQNTFFNHKFILMDVNAAMVNPATQEVSFVYVPITFYESGTSLKEFLLSIIQCCSFVPGENTSYVKDYIAILNRGINFSVFDLEEYVKNLKSGTNDNQTKKCTHCGNVIQPNMKFCSSCGIKVMVEHDKLQNIYNPIKNIVNQQPPANNVGNGAVNRFEHTNVGMADLNEKPQPEQVVNPAVNPVFKRPAYLFRVATGEQTEVSSDSFRIGKDPFNCEYCIGGNPAISRCHALIKRDGNRWFINDLNSTNKTYINGKPLQPYVDVELFNGVGIYLANEKLIFNLY